MPNIFQPSDKQLVQFKKQIDDLLTASRKRFAHDKLNGEYVSRCCVADFIIEPVKDEIERLNIMILYYKHLHDMDKKQ